MFRINRKDLLVELALLIPIAGQKNVIPALSCIRFNVQETAKLTASNSDVALLTEIPFEGEKWQGCIPARQVYDLVRLSNADEVIFTPQGDFVQIGLGKSRHRLPVVGFYAFPDVQGPESKEKVSVAGKDFQQAITRVLPCVSRKENEAKFCFKGVKIEAKDGEMALVGTNSHRMGIGRIPATGEIDVLVPSVAANLLPRFESEEFFLWRSDNQIVFQSGSKTLISRLMAGEFPNWRSFLPKELPLNLTVSTEEWMAAFRRADVTRDETFAIGVGRVLLGVVLVFGKDELVIDTKHSDQGRSEEPVAITSNLNGHLVYMGIDPDYVMDFLRLAGETTECEFKDGGSVLRMTDRSNFEYLVVPQNLREKPA